MAAYLEDYAPPETKIKGNLLLEEKLAEMGPGALKNKLIEKIQLIKEGNHDLYF